jgi:hypothetical protein
VGKYVGEKIGSYIGDKVEDKLKEEAEEQKKKGGSCGGGSGGSGVGEYSASDGQCHKNPKTPLFKLEIEENDLPENWWDKLPDFDPRVFDAMLLDAAKACVDYVMSDDIDKLEAKIEARKFRKSEKIQTQIPRTQVVAPTEITYDTKIDTFVQTDVAY